MARRRLDASGDEHEYVRGPAEGRGPCPALNALANQGYLRRDGRELTVAHVEAALGQAFSMTPRLAASSSRQLQRVLGRDGTFALADLRQHGVLEHDRSFTRGDYGSGGDNYSLRPDMFQALLDDAGGGPVTVRTLARTYRRREREHRQGGGRRLTLRMWLLNLGQTVSLLNAAQTGGALSRELMEALYVEERLPDEIVANRTPRTLLGLVGSMAKLLFHVYVFH